MGDELIGRKGARQPVSTFLDGAIVASMALVAAAAPHSIAATQAAFVLGMIFWVMRLLVSRRISYRPMKLELPILVFVSLSILAAVFSYEPALSIGKLRSVSLFLIVFLVGQNVKRLRTAKLLVLLLVGSCFVNVGFVFWEKRVGRGVRIAELESGSPLREIGIREGDVILRADGRAIDSVEELKEAWYGARGRKLRLFFFRPEIYITREIEVPREGENAATSIRKSERWKEFRAAGFYGWNYFTYAEVLQLIGSLVLGLLLAEQRRWSVRGLSLFLGLLAISYALLLTVTRAAWGAFGLSALVMLVVRMGKRGLLVSVIALALALPLAVRVLKEVRSIPFLSAGEPSTSYRLTVWQEGLKILVSKPRHLLIGVGMDSIKNRWQEWGMFQGGRLPLGHMHSTPIQIALERGVPALVCLVWWFWSFVALLWKSLRAAMGKEDQWLTGILLGALGGTVGFLASSLVHYNFGDSEVIMIIYFLMGITESCWRVMTEEEILGRGRNLIETHDFRSN